MTALCTYAYPPDCTTHPSNLPPLWQTILLAARMAQQWKPDGGYQQQYQQPYQQQGGYDYNQQYNQQYQNQNGAGYNDGSNGYGYNAPQQGEKYTFDQAFKVEKPKWNDLWAAVLFILVFIGFAAVSGLAISGYSKSGAGGGIYDNSSSFSLDSNTIILFAFVLAVAVVLSYAYVWVARLFPKQFIWVTGILNVVFALGTAAYMLYRRYWSGGIVFLIFGLFVAFCFYTWISRIPFSALMLSTAIDVSKKYGHVYMVSWLGGILGAAFGAWYSVTLVSIYARYQPSTNNPNCDGGGCSNGKVIGLIAFTTFAMYWISEVLKNVIHTTIAGVYGSWYFCVNNFPQAATRGALKRSMTHSFGSICFGSLIVAIINFLRDICSVARQQAGADGDLIAYILFCILSCLIALLDWAVSFLNQYAFAHIALYGKAYIPAAKDTWKMIKDRGIDALVNECLIGPVLSFGATFIGYACALLAFLYLQFTDPAYNSDGGYTPVIVAFSFLTGLQIANIFTTPISSGINAIFVASAWDPEVMMRDHPQLYQDMVRVYPKVQEAIHA
ncbi:Protein PNS1 like protein [Verticillium longisporum]|uniref:Protein PNS1 n=1 Tax=Verticillium longisporum TaxID=100787 RepID=A0A8I2ZXZ2_VERLO|nr:Protein PNS1 like protein [Verticillium longisporum]